MHYHLRAYNGNKTNPADRSFITDPRFGQAWGCTAGPGDGCCEDYAVRTLPEAMERLEQVAGDYEDPSFCNWMAAANERLVLSDACLAMVPINPGDAAEFAPIILNVEACEAACLA